MVFTGMQGEMLVDETACRLAKIDGTLFKEVNFGWGILGRLYKGGRFFVEQAEVTPSHWDTTQDDPALRRQSAVHQVHSHR